ncbi:MAG: YARHG domain-containing protein [Bacteroidota bacterium]
MKKIIPILITIIFVTNCGEVTVRKTNHSNIQTINDSIVLSSEEKYVSQIIDSVQYLKYGLDSLRIKRNEVFARKGLIFKSKDLQEYFQQFDWYNPKYKDVLPFLNDIDKENIRIIQNIEAFLSKRLNYFRSFPDIHSEKSIYDFYKVECKDYPFWNAPIPKEGLSYSCIFVNGKKEFSNCIFVLYYSYLCPSPPAVAYYYSIDVYDLDGRMVHSESFMDEDLESFKFVDNNIYFTLNIYESIYSEEEIDSSYYDELHIEKVGTKEKAFFLDAKNMIVSEFKKDRK